MTEQKKKKNKSGLALTLAFLIVVIFLTGWNADRFVAMMKTDLPGITPENAIWRTGSWNTNFTEYFRFRWELIDLYGLFNLSVGKQSLDNFDLVKDGEGVMQKTQEAFDRQQAEDSVKTLSASFAERGIPLIFVAQPPRFTEESFPVSAEVHFFGGRDPVFLKALTDAGVDVLEANVEGKVMLKTDMHLTTAAEFEVARQIAERLETLGIDYRDAGKIFDLGNYDSESHPFYGNLVKSAGRYFTLGGDSFELLHPRFKTDFTIENPESGKERSGDFRHSLMNGMEDELEYVKEPYWVLDYLAYPSAMYTITNHQQEDGCKILFVMDSVAMRSVAYLSLGAGQITVIDPRGENGNALLSEAMNTGDYDAVIVEGGGEEFYFSMDLN
ncbi:MAG: hypothetical protein LBN12_03630 [Clostridiales Family XIII bacterium]|jgi:hypothetical protein|nr:hypothetical protein [Clostridiales Family XIII bacterium]